MIEDIENQLINPNLDSVKRRELLYQKKGSNVKFAANFEDFYNMELSFQPPYITKKSSGGRKSRTKRNKKSKKRRTRRR